MQQQVTRGRGYPASFWYLLAALVGVLTAAIVVVMWPANGRVGVSVLGEKTAAPAASKAGNSGCGKGNGGALGDKSCANPGHSIVVLGSALVDGDLAPGATRTLRVTVDNTNNQDVRVTYVHVEVQDPGSGCETGWFHVPDFTMPSQPIGRNSVGTVDLQISMDDASTRQDVCKGVTLPLKITAIAIG